ncbi:MAG: CRISPR-associated endonuclease Cas2 [Patescibacteria group bacterium]
MATDNQRLGGGVRELTTTKERLHRNSKTYDLLRDLVVAGGLITISLIAPLAGSQLARSIVKTYSKDKRSTRSDLIRDLKRLQSRELLDYKELGDGKIKITLTRRGRRLALTYKLDELQLHPQPRWDGKWRLVMFDIPHTRKQARDALRKKLKDLGFYQLQKSVFITPHSCEDEIDFVASVFNVRQCILIFPIGGFEGQEVLKKYFGL